MRTVGTALVFAALLAAIPARPVQPQIGGFIKKKAVDAAKGKATDDGPVKTSWTCDGCGPITAEAMQALLRGLKAEGAAREEFDSQFAKAEANREQNEAKVKACRDAEKQGPTAQKMMIDGFSGSNPPSTPEAVGKLMEKNKAKIAEYLDTKCGKDPTTTTSTSANEQRAAYAKAHDAGIKASGLDQRNYDFLQDPPIAFCKLTKDQQKEAVEKGLRAGSTKNWLFTVDEAKAIQPYCNELMPAFKKAGSLIA